YRGLGISRYRKLHFLITNIIIINKNFLLSLIAKISVVKQYPDSGGQLITDPADPDPPNGRK
ncbi:MAG: hypothetical protein ACK56I_11255, partial [bacterium]